MLLLLTVSLWALFAVVLLLLAIAHQSKTSGRRSRRNKTV